MTRPLPRRLAALGVSAALLATALAGSAGSSAAGTGVPPPHQPSAPTCPAPSDVTAYIGVEDPDLPYPVDIYRPTGDKVVPAVVLVHGGAWRTGATRFMCDEAVYLARHGIAAIAITYTLSEDVSPSYPDAWNDVVETVETIVASSGAYDIDTTELGVWGVSAGANFTAMLTTQAAELDLPVVVGVGLAGPMALTDGSGVDDPSGQPVQDLIAYLGCNPLRQDPACEAVAAEASPITYVTSADPRLVLVHGTEDEIVPVEQLQVMDATLGTAGADHDTYEIETDAHAAGLNCLEVVPGVATVDLAVDELGTALLGPAFRPLGDFVAC